MSKTIELKMKRLRLDAEVLESCSEGMLLNFVVQEFKLNNKNMDAIAVISEAAECSSMHLSNVLSDRSTLGIESWAGIVKATNTNLFCEWTKVVWKKHGLPV